MKIILILLTAQSAVSLYCSLTNSYLDLPLCHSCDRLVNVTSVSTEQGRIAFPNLCHFIEPCDGGSSKHEEGVDDPDLCEVIKYESRGQWLTPLSVDSTEGDVCDNREEVIPDYKGNVRFRKAVETPRPTASNSRTMTGSTSESSSSSVSSSVTGTISETSSLTTSGSTTSSTSISESSTISATRSMSITKTFWDSSTASPSLTISPSIMKSLETYESILDFGCGYEIIGGVLKTHCPKTISQAILSVSTSGNPSRYFQVLNEEKSFVTKEHPSFKGVVYYEMRGSYVGDSNNYVRLDKGVVSNPDVADWKGESCIFCKRFFTHYSDQRFVDQFAFVILVLVCLYALAWVVSFLRCVYGITSVSGTVLCGICNMFTWCLSKFKRTSVKPESPSADKDLEQKRALLDQKLKGSKKSYKSRSLTFMMLLGVAGAANDDVVTRMINERDRFRGCTDSVTMTSAIHNSLDENGDISIPLHFNTIVNMGFPNSVFCGIIPYDTSAGHSLEATHVNTGATVMMAIRDIRQRTTLSNCYYTSGWKVEQTSRLMCYRANNCGDSLIRDILNDPMGNANGKLSDYYMKMPGRVFGERRGNGFDHGCFFHNPLCYVAAWQIVPDSNILQVCDIVRLDTESDIFMQIVSTGASTSNKYSTLEYNILDFKEFYKISNDLTIKNLGYMASQQLVIPQDLKVVKNMTSGTMLLAKASTKNNPVAGMLGDIQSSTLEGLTHPTRKSFIYAEGVLNSIERLNGGTQFHFKQPGTKYVGNSTLPRVINGDLWKITTVSGIQYLDIEKSSPDRLSVQIQTQRDITIVAKDVFTGCAEVNATSKVRGEFGDYANPTLTTYMRSACEEGVHLIKMHSRTPECSIVQSSIQVTLNSSFTEQTFLLTCAEIPVSFTYCLYNDDGVCVDHLVEDFVITRQEIINNNDLQNITGDTTFVDASFDQKVPRISVGNLFPSLGIGKMITLIVYFFGGMVVVWLALALIKMTMSLTSKKSN